jgi:DNA polymerase-3 subunit beta
MDLYIDRDELGRGLARIQGIIERRSTFPMLSHALFHAHSGGLRLTATDTEIAYIGDLAANVQKPGEIAVDAANLFAMVRALPEPTVRMQTLPGNKLDLSSGRSQVRLPGAPASEFPAMAAFDPRGVARLSEASLRRLVDQTSFAVATEDHRLGLNGAHLEERTNAKGERVLRVVSTDGHRLSAAEAKFEGEVALTPRMLVPRKAMAVMKKLLEGDAEQVELSFGEGALRLQRPGQTFWFRLLDGEFPDYQAVVPGEGKHVAMIGREELGATLKRVSILVQDRARAVKFAFRENELEIQVHNVDRGEIVESLPIELEGEPITAGFNVRYLQDILGVVSGSTVRLEMAHPLAPCLVRDPDNEEAFFVVMPMRLD